MKKENSKRQNQTNKSSEASYIKGILVPFFITLTLVLLAGGLVLALFGGKHTTSKNGTQTEASDNSLASDNKMGNAMDNIMEEIPEHERKDTTNGIETKDQIEQVEEIGTEEPEEVDTSRYGAIINDAEYLRENHIYPITAASSEEAVFTFAGDILFDHNYSMMSTLRANEYVLSRCIAPEILQKMQAADVMMINNEFPYSERGIPLEDKAFTFCAKTDTVKFLEEMGVDIVSLANNHAYDYGEEALLDTFSTLEDRGILYVGAGHNKEEAKRPVYYIVNDYKIAIVSATQIEKGDAPNTKGATEEHAGVFRCWNDAELLEQIRMAKENSDFVIVFIHWGTENQVEIDWAQEKQAPEIVEAGADLIIGDHPHILQKIGMVKGVPVIYSLGNFWFNSKTIDTCLLSATFSKEGLDRLQFIPCLQSGSHTTLLEGGEKQRVIDYMNSISTGVHLDMDGYIIYE